MTRRLAVTLIALVMIGCNKSKEPYHGKSIDLSFEEKRTFGQPDSLSESTIHYAREARLGPNGNIYVADAGVSKIKVYSPSGKFVNSFGKRGRGPGEFTGIRGFAVTDSTVLAWDQDLQRMTVFGLDGKLRDMHNFEGVVSPMRIYPMKNSYLIFHAENRNPNKIKKTRLAHIYPSESTKQIADFLTINDVEENIEYISRMLLVGYGNILIQNNQQFVFVPYIYNGNLYQYSKTAEGWQQTRVFEGLNQQTPYSLVEEGDKRKADASISAVDLAKDREFVIHNLTKGLFKYNGYIFHFVLSDISNSRVFGVEIYDKNVSPVGFAPIKSIPITDKEGNFIDWTVEAVDKKGNFYFLQETDKGRKIRVLSLTESDWEKLGELSP